MEVMEQLESMGSEQTKKTFLRHGAKEPLFGVKVGDMKKLVKEVKKDQELLQRWVREAGWYSVAEYTIAWIAAESPFAAELAMEWIDSPEELIATCGWSTYSNYVSIAPDVKLDIEEIRRLLTGIETTIHGELNRVRYTMNGFVIAVGSYVMPLHGEAIWVAERIGKVDVNVGETACKVPLATDYIQKVELAGKLGNKKKTCIC